MKIMRRTSLATSLLLAGLFVTSASAMTLADETALVDHAVQENIYATGGTVAIKAPVTGDVVAFGGDVTIEAPVTGDVTAAGGTVHIAAPVSGDVRVAGSRLLMENTHVGGDIVYFGSQFALDKQSSASGDVMIEAGQAIFQGNTAKKVELDASDLNFGGNHAGPVRLGADTLQFFGDTQVQGDLSYTAGSIADASAVKAGKILVQEQHAKDIWEQIQIFLLMAGYASLASLILAAVLMWAQPMWSLEVTKRMYSNLFTTLFAGIFMLFAVPGVLGMLFSLQLVLVPWGFVLLPFILVAGLLYALLILLTPGMVAILFARILPKFRGEPLRNAIALPIGALITGVIVALPYIGAFAGLILMALAFGSMVRGRRRIFGDTVREE